MPVMLPAVPMRRRTSLLLTLWLAAVIFPVFAEQAPDQTKLVDDAEVWLRGPEMRQMPWKVKVMPPRLGFEMRQLVMVRVTVDADELRKAGEQRELLLLLRVADEGGRWLEPGNVTRYSLKQKLAKTNLEFSSVLYLRPGRYNLAVLLCDDVLHQRNVTHVKVTMPALKNDPLPGIDDHLPAAEFADFVTWLSEYDSKPVLALPVSSARPLLVDVVINFSPSAQYTGRTWAYENNIAVLLRAAHVLSQLRVQNGCVRFTGLDVLGLKVLFDRIETDNIFWDRLVERATSVSSAVVDVSTLQAQKETADFFRDKIRSLFTNDADGCISLRPDAQPDHFLIVAGSDMQFPPGTHIEGVETTAAECGCRVFFLHRKINNRNPNDWDEMHSILKPLAPRSLSFDTPEDFRKSLAKISAELQHGSIASDDDDR